MTQGAEDTFKQCAELIEKEYQRGYNAGFKKAMTDEEAYERGFAAGQEQAYEEINVNKYIEQGRNEAWEAMRTIIGLGEPLEICGVAGFRGFVCGVSASEAISKIKAYKEQEKDSEIRVGDEVIYNCGNDKDKATVIDIDGDVLHLLTENGCYISEKFKDVKKTNRNFSEIAEVLKKMQEDSV